MTDPPIEDHEAEDPVVAHNLLIMDQSLPRVLNGESMGGNAGRREHDGKIYMGRAVHGFTDPQSGQIVLFANIQEIKSDRKKLIEGMSEFMFQFETETLTWSTRIADVQQGALNYLTIDHPMVSDNGLQNLRKTAKQWNKIQIEREAEIKRERMEIAQKSGVVVGEAKGLRVTFFNILQRMWKEKTYKK